MIRIVLVLLMGIVLVACSAEADTEATVSEFVLEDVRDVFDTEEHAATPLRVQVTDNGHLYVLDQINRQVLVLSLDGEVLYTMGREGEGPGEFTIPRKMAVSDDSIRVLDVGARRVQVFTTDGQSARSYDVPEIGMGGQYASFWPDGRLALPTLGVRADHLVRQMDKGGTQVASIGTLLSESTEALDPSEIHAAAAQNRVADMLRNWALPIPASDGGLWILLHADATVQHYDASGVLQQEFAIDIPEIVEIRDNFLDFNSRLEGQPMYLPLQLATNGYVVDDKLWLRLFGPDESPTEILVYSQDGTLSHRLNVPEAPGATDFALSPDRRTLYLAVPTEARLLAVDLPEVLTAP